MGQGAIRISYLRSSACTHHEAVTRLPSMQVVVAFKAGAAFRSINVRYVAWPEHVTIIMLIVPRFFGSVRQSKMASSMNLFGNSRWIQFTLYWQWKRFICLTLTVIRGRRSWAWQARVTDLGVRNFPQQSPRFLKRWCNQIRSQSWKWDTNFEFYPFATVG